MEKDEDGCSLTNMVTQLCLMIINKLNLKQEKKKHEGNAKYWQKGHAAVATIKDRTVFFIVCCWGEICR